MMSNSKNLHEDIDRWSNATENPILTPAASEAGGPWDDESGWHTSSTYQREHDKDLPKPWKGTNPWPGKAYIITEKTSGRPITVENGELFLQALDRPGQEVTQTANNTWLCCEENNYWAFQNVPTGRYIGHDGGDGMCVRATKIQNWEMMVARPLANGGYQLLMPHYWHTLQMIAIAQDGRHLTRQIHGGAVWEFRMVQPW
jgi:hypothetical protein